MTVTTFIRARNFTPTSGRKVNRVVMHTMEAPEGLTTAESVSQWAAGPGAPLASWHYAVDVNSVVQCVLEKDVAWAAPGSNHDGIQIELAGRAGQTAAQWADPYSKSQLALAALLVAEICKRHDIPPVKLTPAQVRAGGRGICGHIDVTRAFPNMGTHWDPGPNFPWDEFLGMVREALAPKPLRNWPVPIPGWFWEWAKWQLNGKQGPRPATAPPPGIQWAPGGKYAWAWTRLKALQAARK